MSNVLGVMYFVLLFLLKNQTRRVDTKPLLDLEQQFKFIIKLPQFNKLLHFNSAVITAVVYTVMSRLLAIGKVSRSAVAFTFAQTQQVHMGNHCSQLLYGKLLNYQNSASSQSFNETRFHGLLRRQK